MRDTGSDAMAPQRLEAPGVQAMFATLDRCDTGPPGGAVITRGGGLEGVRSRLAAFGRHPFPAQSDRRTHPDHDRGAMRIVVAEDQFLLREGLVRMLQALDHQVVATAADGPETLQTLLTHRPEAAIIDVRMPPTNTDEGLVAALQARQEIPGLPVLVLSQHVEQLYARELLAGGAGGVGYLLKDSVFNADEFLGALERVAHGGTALDPPVVAKLLGRPPTVS